MPIAPYTHNLKTADGKPLFVVRMKNPIHARRLNLEFYNGEGRTEYEAKAKRLDEEFGYLVVLPKGHKGWKLATKEQAESADEMVESTGGLYNMTDDMAGEDSA